MTDMSEEVGIIDSMTPQACIAGRRSRMTFRQIVNMNIGFFGIQFSFGLQQSNMSSIYKYLGAADAMLPYLWLAGPITGLLVQPLVGAMSDRTTSRFGRRTPYFVIGALICSVCLLAMPYSRALWMAAGLLWILDASNNVTMEPYRAFVTDQLHRRQHDVGFLTQSAFTGLSQTLAYLTPSILVGFGMSLHANARGIPDGVVSAFVIGAVISTSSILWSVITTPETPLPKGAAIVRRPFFSTWRDIGMEIIDAARHMPPTMRQLAVMMFFQWYAMFCYWQYVVMSISQSLFGSSDVNSAHFDEAVLISGQLGGFYNFVAFVAAFFMIPVARRLDPKRLHAVCLFLGSAGILALPEVHHRAMAFVPMVGIGLAWASIMGNPYTMLARCIPADRAGVYMGLFNLFIVLPMLVQILTIPPLYHLLGSNPRSIVTLAGVMLFLAAICALFIRPPALEAIPR